MPVIYSGEPASPTTPDTPPSTGLPPGRLLGEDYVRLGDVVFNQVDDSGVVWSLTKITGWNDVPAAVGDVNQRTAEHGGWPAPAYLPPRMVEIEGQIETATHAQMHQAVERLNTAVSLDLALLTVTEAHLSRQAMVRQSGPVLTVDELATRRTFSLSVVAPDPRKYAVDVVTDSTGLPSTAGGLTLPFTLPATLDATMTSGRVTTVNAGNFPTPPVLVVRGPCPPFRITHMGQGATLRYHEAVGPGRFVHIDTANRRVLLDGVAPRRVTGTWFHYVPGVNEVAFSADTYEPAARLTTTFRSAWK